MLPYYEMRQAFIHEGVYLPYEESEGVEDGKGVLAHPWLSIQYGLSFPYKAEKRNL